MYWLSLVDYTVFNGKNQAIKISGLGLLTVLLLSVINKWRGRRGAATNNESTHEAWHQNLVLNVNERNFNDSKKAFCVTLCATRSVVIICFRPASEMDCIGASWSFPPRAPISPFHRNCKAFTSILQTVRSLFPFTWYF